MIFGGSSSLWGKSRYCLSFLSRCSRNLLCIPRTLLGATSDCNSLDRTPRLSSIAYSCLRKYQVELGFILLRVIRSCNSNHPCSYCRLSLYLHLHSTCQVDTFCNHRQSSCLFRHCSSHRGRILAQKSPVRSSHQRGKYCHLLSNRCLALASWHLKYRSSQRRTCQWVSQHPSRRSRSQGRTFCSPQFFRALSCDRTCLLHRAEGSCQWTWDRYHCLLCRSSLQGTGWARLWRQGSSDPQGTSCRHPCLTHFDTFLVRMAQRICHESLEGTCSRQSKDCYEADPTTCPHGRHTCPQGQQCIRRQFWECHQRSCRCHGGKGSCGGSLQGSNDQQRRRPYRTCKVCFQSVQRRPCSCNHHTYCCRFRRLWPS